MKRAVLIGGVLAMAIPGQVSAEDMLRWCVNTYPSRVEWCRSQYPGTLETPEANKSAPSPATPAAPSGSKLTALLPKISGRSGTTVRTFALAPNGMFGGTARQISEAVRAAVRYADITLKDDDCNEFNDSSKPECMSSDDFVTVIAKQKTGTETTQTIEVEAMITEGDGRGKEIFDLGTTVDALSRMLDPDLTDGQRAGVLAQLGESYFASQRKKGQAVGKQAQYELEEDGGTLSLKIVPAKASESNLSTNPSNPVLAFATALDRDDLVKPDPLEAPAILARISDQRALARQLLEQLDGFRYERRFQAVGFSGAQPYHGWLMRVHTISRVDSDETLRQAGVRYGSYMAGLALYNMAMEYMHNEGKDTEESIQGRKDVLKFLNGK